ncbi:MAG: hypothetical protein RBS80_24130 [Thermoguttaceae bacterium]|jgi:hypothetical protein|nr:hypothetical protein [Thermoguttaceae bacterium]
MSFIDPFDPLDAFMYDEFVEPAVEYQCGNCERLFGEENVVWSEEQGATFSRAQATAAGGWWSDAGAG